MSLAANANAVRLTVAMIVRDEEALLPAALESVRGIADEIVVYDTGSQDRSVEIAQSHGANVVAGTWADSFSTARNACWDHATGDWVLWLDAGERLSPGCAAGLRQFINERAALDKAYLLMIELPPAVAGDTPEQAARIRLVPNLPRLRYAGRVRETLASTLAALDITLEMGPWRLLRTGRENDPVVKRGRAVRDLKLIELELQESGPNSTLLIAMADACAALGEHDKAGVYYRQAISIAERGSTDMLSAYYGLLTALPDPTAIENRQLETCIAALEVFPYDAQLLCAMGSYLQAQGQPSLAQRSYRAAHQFGQVNPETWHVANIGEVAAICLSLNLQLLGDDEGALAVLLEAKARFARSAKLARRRIELYVKRGAVSEAIAELELLPIDRAARDLMRSVVRGAVLANQKNWTPALAYLEIAFTAGCRDPLCLRWYTTSLFATASYGATQQVLDEWARVEPHCGELAQFRAALGEVARVDMPAVGKRAPSAIPAPHLRLPAQGVGSPSGQF